MMGMKWLAQSTIYRDSVDLLAVCDDGGRRTFGLPCRIVMQEQRQDEVIIEPTLALSPLAARSLMQALWDAGIRPNDGRGSEAEATALRSHIEFAEHVARTLLGKQL